MSDRLTRDLEPVYTGDPVGVIDEIVLTNAFVHLERLDRNVYMLIVENDRAHFPLTAAVGRVTEYELRADGRGLGRLEEWEADQ